MKITRPPRSPLEDAVFAQRYRAMSSRDSRFDGQFITGVHTTGIYCRPSCPATTPRPENVSFYLTTAAAHAAGLRACKRCLPDAVPGSPEWNLRDDLSARAMRLISDGVVERIGVPGLADRLGYTPRHLNRIMVSELGAGPLALARAHRAQTARLLLTGTDLPITDIAFASGFSSVRQFNETMSEVYELTPRAIRSRGSRHPDPGTTDGSTGAHLTVKLPARAPFDAASAFAFLARRAIDGVEVADATTYRRSLRLPSGPGTISLRSEAGGAAFVTCELGLANVADLAPAVARVRRLLDLDADAEAIDRVLVEDPALRSGVERHPGLRVPGSVDGEELLFRALIGQQVSVAAARTALRRLTDALGTPFATARTSSPYRLFPTAGQIAAEGGGVLRGPARRVETILDVARRLADGRLVLDVGESRKELEDALLGITGIGPWTAGYVAMRVLGSPDVLLTDDLALRSGAAALGLPSDRRLLAERAARWAPWRSYAGMHLWAAARA